MTVGDMSSPSWARKRQPAQWAGAADVAGFLCSARDAPTNRPMGGDWEGDLAGARVGTAQPAREMLVREKLATQRTGLHKTGRNHKSACLGARGEMRAQRGLYLQPSSPLDHTTPRWVLVHCRKTSALSSVALVRPPVSTMMQHNFVSVRSPCQCNVSVALLIPYSKALHLTSLCSTAFSSGIQNSGAPIRHHPTNDMLLALWPMIIYVVQHGNNVDHPVDPSPVLRRDVFSISQHIWRTHRTESQHLRSPSAKGSPTSRRGCAR